MSARISLVRIGLLLPAFIFCTSLAMAQPQAKFSSDFWHAGKIVLDGGDTLKGQLKYNLQNDVVQVQYNGRIETFTPRKAVFFEIFDQLLKRYRDFYSLPYSGEGQYKVPTFFELMEEGKLTLLYRESVEYRTYTSSYYSGGYTRLVLVNKYYFLNPNGSIAPFTGKKVDLLDMMGQYSDEVKKYTKQKKINYDLKYGFGEMVHYYNSIAH